MLFILLIKEKGLSAKRSIALLEQDPFLITLYQDYGHITLIRYETFNSSQWSKDERWLFLSYGLRYNSITKMSQEHLPVSFYGYVSDF